MCLHWVYCVDKKQAFITVDTAVTLIMFKILKLVLSCFKCVYI